MKHGVFLTLLSVGMAALAATPAWSAVDKELLKCRAFKDASTRVACYDDYVGKATARAPETPDELSLTVVELKVDGTTLVGKDVVIEGFMTLLSISEVGVLSDRRDGGADVYVRIAKLPREQRLAVFQRCNSRCAVRVAGKVTDDIEIDATSITLK